jgi:transposase InsO family protein
MIFDFMKEHAVLFPVKKMAIILEVSRAGYYKYIHKKESLRAQANKKLVSKISSIYQEKREVYGSPRIHAELKKRNEKCSRKLVAKLMRINNIRAKSRKKWSSYSRSLKDLAKIAPNIVNQNFVAPKPNKIWVSDVTHIRTGEGWLYVAAIMDLFSRKIVGLGMSDLLDANLINKAYNQAVRHRSPQSGLILHSDRGAQYTSDAYQNLINKQGVILSMSARGNCYDNAAMESFFHTLKTEHVHFQKYETKKEASNSIFEYIEIFYNRQRMHSTLNYLSPVEFEQKFESSRMKLALPATEAK